MNRATCLHLIFVLFCFGTLSAKAVPTEVSGKLPIPIKVVVVSMVESGAVSGDRPGEFQFWVERMPLDISLPFPAGEYELRLNKDGVLGMCTGGGIPNATASVMALGFDERFDFSQAYWLVAGIAGGDPEDMSLGSAAWANFVIDGDLLFEIDAREIPEDWPYGIVPLGGKKPAKVAADLLTGWTVDTIKYQLNSQLVNWAYETSKDVKLPQSPASMAFGQQFSSTPNAMKAPFVTKGDTLSSSTYWHGNRLNEWANDWVKLYSAGQGNFMTTNMEDSGTLTALRRLARVGRVDMDRILVLRTASNFTVPPPGKAATWSATADYPDDGRPALEAAYHVGRVVVDAIVSGWSIFQHQLPVSGSVKN